MEATITIIEDGRRRPAKPNEIPRDGKSDGKSVRVPLLLMDGVQRSVALSSRFGAARYRFGHLFAPPSAATEARDAAYAAEGERVSSAWRGTPPPAPVSPPARQLTGDEREDAWTSQSEYLRNAWKGAA